MSYPTITTTGGSCSMVVTIWFGSFVVTEYQGGWTVKAPTGETVEWNIDRESACVAASRRNAEWQRKRWERDS